MAGGGHVRERVQREIAVAREELRHMCATCLQSPRQLGAADAGLKQHLIE